MKKEQVESWRKIRKKGFVRFLLENGLLAWGLPMFIAMAFITKPFAEGFASKAAIVHYVMWPLGGIIYGVTVWWLSERRYRKALANESNA